MTTLIVEDNPLDVRMIRYAIEKEKWFTEFVVADDGEKAFRYLQGEAPYGDTPLPDFVILDLNLPKRSGSEVLQLVRSTSSLAHLPVAILSSSPEDVIRDIVGRTCLQVELLLTKPSDVGEYLEIGKELRRCYEEHRGQNRSAGSGQTD